MRLGTHLHLGLNLKKGNVECTEDANASVYVTGAKCNMFNHECNTTIRMLSDSLGQQLHG